MIRVLVAAARVNKETASFADEFHRQIEYALSFGLRHGDVKLHFAAASERGLRASFTESSWDILHLIAPVQVIATAHYAKVDLESVTGSSRSVSSQYLTDILAESRIPNVVLYSAGSKSSFDLIAEKLAQGRVPNVVTAHDLSPEAMAGFLPKLHLSLADGELRRHVAASRISGIRVWAQQAATKAEQTVVDPVPRDGEEESWRPVIDKKRALGQFDVFLCHNHVDAPSVLAIARRLERAGIRPWVDAHDLPAGLPWIPVLESQIKNIHSAAVFIGAAGIGRWQQEEVGGFLRRSVEGEFPVIPVLLADAPLEPKLPVFLEGRTYVDFRSEEGNPLKRLIWAITGVTPTCL